MSESRRPAVLRGVASSTLAIFIALTGHVSAGGAMPGPLGLLVPWALSLMVCILLAGRKVSTIRLALSVAVSQFLFHLLFVLGTVTSSSATSQHVHGAPLALPASDGVTDVAVAGGSMWVGHLIAAAVTVGALRWGEGLVHALMALARRAVQWLRRRVDAAVTPVAPSAPRFPRGFDTAMRRLTSPHLSPLRGRAPPAIPAI